MNERIQELIEKFPDVPITIILKIDACREGIKYTPILKEIGKWAIPQGNTYEMHLEEFFRDETLKGKTTMELPNFMHFKDGTTTHLILKESSPYEVEYEGNGRYWLYRDGEPVEEIYFVPRPEWVSKKTSDGTEIGSIVVPLNDCWS